MMEKLDRQTPDLTEELVDRLAQLMPNVVTEDVDDGGNVVRTVDFDVLRESLTGSITEGRRERYQFTWPGKAKARLEARIPTEKAMRPVPERSVNWDTTENLYIEGDNLEALKILRETYAGKVKLIYIDPPYNTGHDFIYDDDFAETHTEYAASSGDYSEEGGRLVSNPETNGRFHSDWCSMMYPRLLLARDLLSQDGLVFISIDDSEVTNLNKLCSEVFGQSNFIAQLIWQNKKGGGNDSLYIANEHEYVLVYARQISSLSAFYEQYSEEYAKRYKEKDEIGRFYWDTFKRKSGKQYYPIECPDGTILQYDEDGNPISWLRSKARFESDIKAGEIRIVPQNGGWSVQFKQRMPKGKKPRSIFTTNTVVDDKGTTSTGSSDVYRYFKKDVFSNPKPVDLLKYIIGFGLQDGELALDFFSGSGTLAEAVMRANLEDGGDRHFILVQLPESIDEALTRSSGNARVVAENAITVLDSIGKPHLITELAEERLRRVGRSIASEREDTSGQLAFSTDNGWLPDIGFRVLRVDEPALRKVHSTPGELLQGSLFDYIDNLEDGATDFDLLFQVLPKLRMPFSSRIEVRNLLGKEVFFVNSDAGITQLIACFSDSVTSDLIEAIAKEKPIYAVFRDASFADDSAVANLEELFKTFSSDTIRRVI